MADQFFVRVMGVENGPIDGSELTTMAAEGRIGPDDMVRRGPAGPWQDAMSLQGLFDPKNKPVASGYSKARAANPQAFTEEKQPMFSAGFKIAIGSIVAILAAAVFAVAISSPPSGSEHGAIAKSKEIVLESLKAPSEAVFVDDKTEVRNPKPNYWIVSGQVDAPNSFGVKLRQGWIVGIGFEGGRWKVDTVHVGGR